IFPLELIHGRVTTKSIVWSDGLLRSSPPSPVRAVAVLRLYHRIVAGISKPAAQFAAVRVAQAPLENPAEPFWCAAVHRDFRVRVKASDRPPSRLRARIEQNVRAVKRA